MPARTAQRRRSLAPEKDVTINSELRREAALHGVGMDERLPNGGGGRKIDSTTRPGQQPRNNLSRNNPHSQPEIMKPKQQESVPAAFQQMLRGSEVRGDTLIRRHTYFDYG